MNRPSWLLDIPAEEYHQATKDNRYFTSHRCAILRKCPLEYKMRHDGIMVEKDTESFVLGRATHTYILEGKEKFDAEYVVCDGPINEKTGKPFGKATEKYRAWYEAQAKPVISTEDFAQIEDMSEEVHRHVAAADLISEGIAEGTVRVSWDGEPVQARLDWFDPERNIIVDLKTCADIDRFRFDIRDFGYGYQLAYYAKSVCLARAGAGEGDVRVPECYLIAVEKKEPYRVGVVHVSASTISDLNEGHMGGENWRDDNDAMIAELRRYRETGTWPTRYEGVITI